MEKRRIGVDLGGTTISFIDLYELDNINSKKEIKTPDNKEDIQQAVIDTIEEMLSSSADKTKPIGIGIAMAGQINQETGSVIFSPNLPFKEEFPLGKNIEEQLGIKVFMENDANSAAYGEKLFGQAIEMNDFIVLTLGTGIGSGIFCGGKFLIGHAGNASEAGHMTIDINGPDCGCGRKGCLETFASGTAIAKAAKDVFGKEMTAKEVCRQVAGDNEQASQILQSAGEKLGTGIASLINLFNPEAIFFTGSLSNAPDVYINTAIEKGKAESFGTMGKSVRIEKSKLKDGGALGAAAIVM